jgi:hypothetical protein
MAAGGGGGGGGGGVEGCIPSCTSSDTPPKYPPIKGEPVCQPASCTLVHLRTLVHLCANRHRAVLSLATTEVAPSEHHAWHAAFDFLMAKHRASTQGDKGQYKGDRL